MVRIGVPSNIDAYIMVDDELGFILHQKGFAPEWRDGDCLYFKKTNRIVKILKKIDEAKSF